MKTVILFIALMFAQIATAQTFQMDTRAGQGISLNNKLDAEYFTASLSVMPGLNWNDEIKVFAITGSNFFKDHTEYFAGSEIAFRFTQSELKDVNYYFNAKSVFSEGGQIFAGGGVTAEIDNRFSLGADALYDWENELTRIQATLGILIQ